MENLVKDWNCEMGLRISVMEKIIKTRRTQVSEWVSRKSKPAVVKLTQYSESPNDM